MHILDVGCGTGHFSFKLARMGCRVTGIDISGEMLALARRKAIHERLPVDFLSMDASHIDFGDETFDAVVAITAFEFLAKPGESFNEMFRVLKRDGSLLIGTINRDSPWGEMYLAKKPDKESVFHFAHLRTLDELKQMHPAGFASSSECLFVPPCVEEAEIGAERERELSRSGRGGFICVLWKKP
jgi:ubiquinone/menaquinone biosynthesis C-methylase UbiE